MYIIIKVSTLLDQVEEGEYMLAVWRRLAEAASAGSRVVVALLEPHHAAPFLQTAAALRARGLLNQGDLVFIMAQSPWPFIKHEYVLYIFIYHNLFIYIYIYIYIFFFVFCF